jgi:hypothetical protein
MSESEINTESRIDALELVVRSLLVVLANDRGLDVFDRVVNMATQLAAEHPQNAGVARVIGHLAEIVAMNQHLEAQRSRPRGRKDPRKEN